MDRQVDNNPDAPADGSSRRVRSWNAPLLVALASVLVALIYNGVQASNTAKQLDQGQETLELSRQADTFATLMEIHDRIVRAGAQTNSAAAALGEDPSDPELIRLLNAVTPLEGVVFTLEDGVLPAGTERLWAKYLACDYQLASAEKALGGGLAQWVPRLSDFAERHAVPPERCAVRPD